MLLPLIAGIATLTGCTDRPESLVKIQPESATTSTTLVAQGPFPDRRSWTWEVDGQISLETEGRVVDPSQTTRGEVWTVHQWDGETWIGSDSTEILNEPPSLELAWAPDPGTVSLQVTVTDADADQPELTFEWLRNGEPDSFSGTTHDPRTLLQNDRWTVLVTADDGYGGVTTSQAVQRVGNAGPSILTPDINPSLPTAATDIVASVRAQDVNGDRTAARWRWSIDGEVVEGATSNTLPAGTAKRGQTLLVEVEVADSYGATSTSSQQVVLANAAPTLGAVSIEPDPANTLDDLQCIATGVTDADGDVLTQIVQWTVRGSGAGQGANLSHTAFERGDDIGCQVQIVDEQLAASPSINATDIFIENAPPTALGASVSPNDPTALDELSCVMTGFSDPDGDSEQGRYEWFVNGIFIQESDTLEPGIAVHRDEVTCIAYPHDGTDEGLAVLSQPVRMKNTPPEINGSRINPSVPFPWDSITCQPGIDEVDADGDPLTVSVHWYVDDSPYAGATSTAYSGDTIPADVVQAGENWFCQARVSDGKTQVEEVVQTTVADAPGGNILIMVADDLGIDHLNRYGVAVNPPPTPTIDSLVDNGLRFTNAWAYSSCSPTRAALMTGRYGRRTGATALVPFLTSWYELPMDEVTLPEMTDLATVGTYANSAVGKWHVASNISPSSVTHPLLSGWDWHAGSPGNLDVNSLGLSSDFDTWEKWNNGVTEVSTTYATTDTVNDAISRANAMPEPWLLYVAFNAPHYPIHVPPAHLHTSSVTDSDPDHLQFDAMVESLDTEMGRLLAGIPTDVLARTTIIFMSDNGTPRGVVTAPFDSSRAKLTPYEGGINVPLVISGPTVRQPGTETDALVHAVDILPTVAAITGVQLSTLSRPDGSGQIIDGQHLLTWTEDPDNPSKRRLLYGEQSSPVGPPPYATEDTLIATDGKYKLIRFSDHDEFFRMDSSIYDEGPDLIPGVLGPIESEKYQEFSDFVEFQRATLVYEGEPRPAP